jgi:hypothetical protein
MNRIHAKSALGGPWEGYPVVCTGDSILRTAVIAIDDRSLFCAQIQNGLSSANNRISFPWTAWSLRENKRCRLTRLEWLDVIEELEVFHFKICTVVVKP